MTMTRTLLALALALAGCAARSNGSGPGDASPPSDGEGNSDAPPQCSLSVNFSPPNPQPDPTATIRAAAVVLGVQGVFHYNWQIFYGGQPVPVMYKAGDLSQLDFRAPNAGAYEVRLQIDQSYNCAEYDQSLQVQPSGTPTVDYRLRVFPPATIAPPQESVLQIVGGEGNVARDMWLEAGSAYALTITNGTAGVPAYARFAPVQMPDAYVEAFSASDGSLPVRLLQQPHDVYVVPEVAGLAPRHFAWNGATTLVLDPGTAIMGNVKDPSGTALPGATVQLTSNGLPSTLATSDASGNFTLRAAFDANASITATVTPPPGRGLPRLVATAVFTGAQLQIHYATLATCDLSGTPVQRASTAQPGAQVTIAGTLAATAGTIAMGTTANATGIVRVAATADGTGKLPSTVVPRASLSAIVQVSATDLALSTINTTAGCTAQTITAPAMTTAAGVVQGPTQSALRGVEIDATPTGVLAGLPPVQTMTASDGTFSLPLATGALYDVRFVDPAGIGGPHALLGITAAGVPASTVLPTPIPISGTVRVITGTNPNPVVGASVQMLCTSCAGLDATRPIAITTSNAAGYYVVTVADPGSM